MLFIWSIQFDKFLFMYTCIHETTTTVEIVNILISTQIPFCTFVIFSSYSSINAQMIIDLSVIVDEFIFLEMYVNKNTLYVLLLIFGLAPSFCIFILRKM